VADFFFQPMKNSLIQAALLLAVGSVSASAEAMLQYFGTSWSEIERRLPELAERGYDSLWLPPPFKAGAGTYSVGFDTLDRFDLGDRDQSGTIRTMYGTRAELISLMRAAHRFGLRVYFDNVMAHNAGPLDRETDPGELFPGVPGFVPEDFHLVREADGTWRKAADWPNWNDEWQVLNRNPFAWDIAQEGPQNVSFNPNGTGEGFSFPKWSGIRHPGRTEWYLDTDLVVDTNGAGDPVHPFADKEPYQDVGFIDGGNTVGANNGWFDFKDLNANGQHDAGEPSEPFTDTGVDPTVPWRQTAAWGYGDGRYNMGNPVAEDVNQMLFRAVRWFVDVARPDGFRLDAVKHVPAYFFGKQSGGDKDLVNWGYNGQIQEQFNITRGFNDWNSHRDSVFDADWMARNDAMLFGEHLGAPPGEQGYLDAGMRIANDNILNTVRNSIGSNLGGFDQPNHGGWGLPTQRINYVMSHDNNYLWGGDRALAHAHILTREGISIVYTDGYNQAGAPSYFPKPSGVNFLGQFSDNSVISAVAVHRDFARGFQVARGSDQNFAAYERVDERERKDSGGWNGSTMVFMMAKGYQSNGQARWVQTGFPNNATLVNQSPFGGRFRVYVNGAGQIVDGSGNPPIVPPGGWFAFTWHNPRLPVIWQAPEHQWQVAPIQIYQDGMPVPMMDHWRTDGRDGDGNFNPYGVGAQDRGERSYRVKIPRVTDGSNLRIVARADGSADNIRLKLNGGIDVNSQMGLGPQSGDLRDFKPGINSDQFNAGDAGDRRKEASTDTYLGYEQMRFVRRSGEKFAARDISRNVIGSAGSETYQAVIGSPGFTVNNGGSPNGSGARFASWVYHDPVVGNQASVPVPQMNPAPQEASGQPVDLWVKVGYQFQADRVWVYYTTDGTSFPEGIDGLGKGETQVAAGNWSFNGAPDAGGTPDWWKVTLPAMAEGTVLRYKIGVRRTASASPVFPFSSGDIDLAERMESLFEVADFDATSVVYPIHNDYGATATGLEEGFHVLRSRAFVGRGDGSSIYRTETQVFYYDTERPGGEIAYPRQNDTLGGSSYGAVVLTDPSVAEVWYYIDDLDPTNDNPGQGNGLYQWQRASAVTVPSNLGSTGYVKEWRFTYGNIPGAGIANLVVRLKEASSSGDMGLSDEAGHFTTLTRTVNTGSNINFNIGFPSFTGEVVDDNYVMKVYFKKELIPSGMSDQDFLNELSIYISSTVSGQPDTPVLQPRSGYSLVRDVNGAEHSVEFNFPNLYNGMPDFLHTVRVEHARGSLTLGDSELVKMRVSDQLDRDGDSMPDWWEILHGMDPLNSTGRHGGDGDNDQDGVANLDEFLFGMNAAADDALLLPKVSLVPHPTLVGQWKLSFPTLPDRIYQWEASSTLGDDWQGVGGEHSTLGDSSTGEFEWIDTSELPKRFYRIRVRSAL
jgi:hypothetical protein